MKQEEKEETFMVYKIIRNECGLIQRIYFGKLPHISETIYSKNLYILVVAHL